MHLRVGRFCVERMARKTSSQVAECGDPNGLEARDVGPQGSRQDHIELVQCQRDVV
jgi:hypothetical protein